MPLRGRCWAEPCVTTWRTILKHLGNTRQQAWFVAKPKMGDRRGGGSRCSSVHLPWFWAAVLAGCTFLGFVWHKASYRIDVLQQQLDLLSTQLQANGRPGVGGTIGDVQSLVEENLQSQFGFQEQAQLLLKVASEVKALRKSQASLTRQQASAARGVLFRRCTSVFLICLFPLFFLPNVTVLLFFRPTRCVQRHQHPLLYQGVRVFK